MNNIDYRYDVQYQLLTDDPVEGAVACGFLPKEPEYMPHNLNYYSGFLVICGSGEYINEEGQAIPLKAGDFVQRRPGCKHTTTVEEGQPWLEFYICFGPSLYKALVSTHMISNEAVLHTRLRPATIERCEALLLDFKRATCKSKKMLIVSLQSLLLYMNDLSEDASVTLEVPIMVESICGILSKDFDIPLDLVELAKSYKVSYESMRKTFKRYTGVAPNRFRLIKRINEAKRLLQTTETSLKTIAVDLGYANQYAFSTQFKKIVGVSPKRFREES